MAERQKCLAFFSKIAQKKENTLDLKIKFDGKF